MPRPRLLVLAPAPLFQSFFDAERTRRLSRSFDWKRIGGSVLDPTIRRGLREAEALITTWDSPCFGEDLLDLAPRLRIIGHCGGEMKRRFARPLFSRLTLTNAPDPMAPYVAELALAFLLLAARRIDDYREAMRSSSNRIYQEVHTHGGEGALLAETVGLIGFGRIGRALAALLRPFGVRLLVHDPYAPPEAVRRMGGDPVSLSRVLREPTFLVLAAALTDKTIGLLDARRLSALRDGTTVVNIGRGGLLDLEALTREVKSGRLRCALDVTDPLEPLPLRHPLRRMRGAVLTPHVGAAPVAVRRQIADIVIRDLTAFFRGERVRNRVTSAMLERMT